jgi:hypothetical protein
MNFQTDRKKFLVSYFLGLVLIVTWQWLIFMNSDRLGHAPKLRGVSAGLINQDGWERFAYFRHHLGVFPVASLIPPQEDSKEEAQRIVLNHPESLVTEWGHWVIRSGDLGKIWLYDLQSLIFQRGQGLDIRISCFILGLLSLLVLWSSFAVCKKFLLGSVLIFILGSNPFYLYEMHVNKNVFSLSQTGFHFALAMCLPLIFRVRLSFLSTLALMIGLGGFLAIFREIRPESKALVILGLLAVAMAYLSLRMKIFSVLTLIGTMVIVGLGAQAVFRANKVEAAEFVKQNRGEPFTGISLNNHVIFHTLFIGLTDFNRKYKEISANPYPAIAARCDVGAEPVNSDEKCQFLDEIGIELVKGKLASDGRGIKLPSMNDKLPNSRHYHANPYFDGVYLGTIRKVFLDYVKSDPFWYFEILARRAWRIITEMPSVELNLVFFRVPVPWNFAGVLLALILLFYLGEYWALRLVLISLPMSAVPLLVYSGKGATLYSLFPFVSVACLLSIIISRWPTLWRKLYGR